MGFFYVLGPSLISPVGSEKSSKGKEKKSLRTREGK